MADYYPLIAKAVSGLDKSTVETRRGLYDRARSALLGQLRGVEPALSEADITRERLALEEAIRKVEWEAMRRSRGEPLPSRAEFRTEPTRGDALADPRDYGDSPSAFAPRGARPSIAAHDGDERTETDDGREAVPLSAAATARAADGEVRRPERWNPGGPSLSDNGLRSFRESIGDGATPEDGAVRTHPPATRDFGRPEQGPGHWTEPDETDLDQGPEQSELPRVVREVAEPPVPLADQDDRRRRAPHSFPRIVRPERTQAPERVVPEGSLASGWSAPRNTNRIIAIAVIALLALCITGVAFWFGDDILSSLHGASSRTDQTASAHNATHGKIAERAPSAPGSTEGATAPQKVVLYEEDPANPNGTQYLGTAVWRTERVPPAAGQKPEVVIRGDIEIPEQKVSVRLSLSRNDDKQLPASHTVEIRFKLPPDFPHGGIANIPGIMVKQGETARGIALSGVAVKVMDNFFLVGLSSSEAEMQRNVQLLKDRSWFDIPIVYTDGKRAIIAIEKGPPGERAFAEAFAAWEQQPSQTQQQPAQSQPAQSQPAPAQSQPAQSQPAQQP